MIDISKSEIWFLICKIAGFGLMFAIWFFDGEVIGFFLLLFLAFMSLVRWHFPKLNTTVVIDCVACIMAMGFWEYAVYVMILVIFEGMYRKFYWVALGLLYTFVIFDMYTAALTALAIACGVFLGEWEKEHEEKLNLRDAEVSKYYKLESLQSDLMASLVQVEKMTKVNERARISREVHDNAGHEIVAAYISLQTVRKLFEEEDDEILELYDTALQRLNGGANKIREAVHNLKEATPMGVEGLLDICRRFPACSVDFRSHGDSSTIPIYIWNMLESCLNESLTNVAKHSYARRVAVELDVTKHIVRLSIENDGVNKSTVQMGNGLNNLRHRAIAIGGNITIDAGEVFRIICVIPIQEENNEFINS